jgi:hypothetical protein
MPTNSYVRDQTIQTSININIVYTKLNPQIVIKWNGLSLIKI